MTCVVQSTGTLQARKSKAHMFLDVKPAQGYAAMPRINYFSSHSVHGTRDSLIKCYIFFSLF